jgi:hypothetical protein
LFSDDVLKGLLTFIADGRSARELENGDAKAVEMKVLCACTS